MKKLIVLFLLMIAVKNLAQKKTYTYVITDKLISSFPDWEKAFAKMETISASVYKKYDPKMKKCMEEVNKGQKRYSEIIRSQKLTSDDDKKLQADLYLTKYAECEQIKEKMDEEITNAGPEYNMYKKILTSISKKYKNKGVELIPFTSNELNKTSTQNDITKYNIKDVTQEVITKIKSHIKRYKTLKMASLMKVD